MKLITSRVRHGRRQQYINPPASGLLDEGPLIRLNISPLFSHIIIMGLLAL